jgi:beta-xylosidase
VGLDVSGMKDGDCAGLALLQRNYGLVGVKQEGGTRHLVMVSVQNGPPTEAARLPLTQNVVHFKAECDFNNRRDVAWFYYSLDGKTWTRIGSELKMTYTLPHFMGYRFALFNYATQEAGGHVDFDYFRISDRMTEPH